MLFHVEELSLFGVTLALVAPPVQALLRFLFTCQAYRQSLQQEVRSRLDMALIKLGPIYSYSF